MKKKAKLTPRAERILKEVVQQEFRKAVKKNEVLSIGVTNIDLSKTDELAKVTAIINSN